MKAAAQLVLHSLIGKTLARLNPSKGRAALCLSSRRSQAAAVREQEALESASRSWSYCARSLVMSDIDPKTTLREFKEYVATSFESPHKLAARVGVRQSTFDWLAGKHYPTGKSLAKLSAFLDAEAKRQPHGNGIRPIERMPERQSEHAPSNTPAFGGGIPRSSLPHASRVKPTSAPLPCGWLHKTKP